ncbi:hypothetical protein [Mucilaginibacter antarcticus]|uniref:hypothetical protein n=1 Tax=Mucilaginibacter antarcticus TaxID=1855725 RepID=UPI0036359656
MKKAMYLLITMVICAANALAQKAAFTRVDALDQRPLVVVNGKIVDALSFLALDKYDFESIKILPAADAIKKYGADDGRYGAVQIRMIKTTQLLNWAQVARRFYFMPEQIPAQARLFYGYFGGLTFCDTRLFVASASKVSGMFVHAKYPDRGMPMMGLGVRYDEGANTNKSLKTTPFDEDIKKRNRFLTTNLKNG